MKKAVVLMFICVVLTGVALHFTSCRKTFSNQPDVTFVIATGYVSADTVLYRGTAFSIWVYATKLGSNDLLESGKITRSVNGGPDSVLQNMTFVKSEFSQTYSYIAADSGTVQRYIFTFANQDGASGSDSVTITSN